MTPSSRTRQRWTGSPDDSPGIMRRTTGSSPTPQPHGLEGILMTTETTPTSPGHPDTELEARGAAATAREIAQQPGLWRRVAHDVSVRRALTEAFLGPLLARPDLRIILTGAGTSAFAGELLATTLERELGRRVDAIATTDLVSSPREHFAVDAPTLLVSFARSGDSPESLAATQLADRCLSECHHLVVTCNPDGELYRAHSAVDRSLVLTMPDGANDRGFAMTSSFTCMVLSVLLTLNRPTAEATDVEALAAAGERVLAAGDPWCRELAARNYERIVYLGSGPLTALARESALKTLELTAGRVATWFDSPLGFRHGPKSVVDPRTLVVVYLSNDPYTRRYDEDMLSELREALPGGAVLAVGGRPGGDSASEDTELVTGAEDVEDVAASLTFVLVAQRLALHLSLELGLTPDNPFPDKQVNRVVQGVTIHPLPRRG
jgi:tagatose-6-phosphate ketose/aldose isomerase